MAFIYILLFICSSLYVFGQTLTKGDLLIVGINQLNRDNTCSTNNTLTHYDNLYFIALNDIDNGEVITLTDNRYLGNQQFNTTEGFYQFERVGGKINKGNFFRIDIPFSAVTINQNFNGWKLINRYDRINLNSAGDQIFILDHGSWNNLGYYHGKILFGYNSFNGWMSIQDTSNSILPSSNLNEYDITSFHFTPQETTTKLYRIYDGPLTDTSKNEWIIRFLNPSNWISYHSGNQTNDCNQFNQRANKLLQSILNVDDYQEIEGCKNQNIILEIKQESIIISYEWIKSYTIDFANYTIIGNSNVLNYNNQETDDFYITCRLTYQLNWLEDNNSLKTSTNTLNGKIYAIKQLSTPNISPIKIN